MADVGWLIRLKMGVEDVWAGLVGWIKTTLIP